MFAVVVAGVAVVLIVGVVAVVVAVAVAAAAAVAAVAAVVVVVVVVAAAGVDSQKSRFVDLSERSARIEFEFLATSPPLVRSC